MRVSSIEIVVIEGDAEEDGIKVPDHHCMNWHPAVGCGGFSLGRKGAIEGNGDMKGEIESGGVDPSTKRAETR